MTGEQPPLTARDLNIEVVPIDTVAPHPDNPRQGDVGVLRDSLDAHGVYQPIIVQRSTGLILAGNHRWLAMKQRGDTEVPVTYLDVNEEQATRIMLADNRTSDMASYDDQALLAALQSIPTLDGTGYSDTDFDDLVRLLEGTLSFDQMREVYPDAPPDDAFWPKISVQVPPDTWQRWQAAMAAAPTEVPHERVRWLLEQVTG